MLRNMAPVALGPPVGVIFDGPYHAIPVLDPAWRYVPLVPRGLMPPGPPLHPGPPGPPLPPGPPMIPMPPPPPVPPFALAPVGWHGPMSSMVISQVPFSKVWSL